MGRHDNFPLFQSLQGTEGVNDEKNKYIFQILEFSKETIYSFHLFNCRKNQLNFKSATHTKKFQAK